MVKPPKKQLHLTERIQRGAQNSLASTKWLTGIYWSLIPSERRLFVIACVRCDLFLNKTFKVIWFFWNANLGFEEMWNLRFIFYVIQVRISDDKGGLKQDGILSYCTQEPHSVLLPTPHPALWIWEEHITHYHFSDGNKDKPTHIIYILLIQASCGAYLTNTQWYSNTSFIFYCYIFSIKENLPMADAYWCVAEANTTL